MGWTAARSDRRSYSRVCGHEVVVRHVCAFNDIDFSASRPVWPIHPDCVVRSVLCSALGNGFVGED